MENKVEQTIQEEVVENSKSETENNNVSESKNDKAKTLKPLASKEKKDLTTKAQAESPKIFEERIVKIKRISKTTKGGRVMRFSALVVIGDKKGTVGFGMGKSNEVPDAIKKAIKNANNNLFNVKMNKRGTVFHEVIGQHGASKLLLKPAPTGKGIVAGGAARAVVELAGYQDIYTKSLGSNCPINVIRAAINGLNHQFTPMEIAKLRDKSLTDL